MEPTTPAPEIQPEAVRPPALSLFARLANVIAAPGDLFDDIKTAPTSSVATWLLPLLMAIIVGWVSVTIIFSNPAIQQQLKEVTEQAMDKAFAQSNLSADQMEKAKESAANIARISQSVGAYVGIPVMLACETFFWAFVLWLVGAKFNHGKGTFLQGLEAIGSMNVLNVLDSVVRTLLILVMVNLYAAPSLVLLVKFDPQNTLHSALGLIEVFTLWCLALRVLALARLHDLSLAKAATWVVGIWVVLMGSMVGLGALGRLIASRAGHH